MMSLKPRGRPPADGNCIVWTQPLVESLLRLRFEKYAQQMTAARGTKALREAWADVARGITVLNNGNVVSVEQCRNKIKALRNKWLAYKAGAAAEPLCAALMDACWGEDKKEEANQHARPSPEHRKHAKKPRLTASSTPVSAKVDPRPLTAIAPAPATSAALPGDMAATPTSASSGEVGVSMVNPAQLLDVSVQSVAHGLPDVDSASTDAAISSSTEESRAMSRLEKLVADKLAKVLENQEKQLRLAEAQNQLLARVLAALRQD